MQTGYDGANLLAAVQAPHPHRPVLASGDQLVERSGRAVPPGLPHHRAPPHHKPGLATALHAVQPHLLTSRDGHEVAGGMESESVGRVRQFPLLHQRHLHHPAQRGGRPAGSGRAGTAGAAEHCSPTAAPSSPSWQWSWLGWSTMLDTQWPDTTASSCLAFQFHSRAVQSSLALASQGRPGWRAPSLRGTGSPPGPACCSPPPGPCRPSRRSPAAAARSAAPADRNNIAGVPAQPPHPHPALPHLHTAVTQTQVEAGPAGVQAAGRHT